MFPLTVITDEISQDLGHALEVAVELGIAQVDLRTLWGKNVIALDDDEAVRAAGLVRGHALSVAMLGTSIFKCFLWEARRRPTRDPYFPQDYSYEEHLRLIGRAGRLAEVFDTSWVRVFAFWRETGPNVWERLLDLFAPALPAAERAGVRLALENIGGCNVASGAEAGRLLRDLGEPRLGLIWDPGNEQWEGTKPYPDGYEHVRGRVTHVHVKDVRPDADGEYGPVLLGDGEVDYRGQLRALRADGYAGSLTLEPECAPPGRTREDGTRESADRLRRLLAEIERSRGP